jgi:NADPH-dependent 2,4-dienoyl-CoA reductase/sulfur reductase-like enzyme
MSAQHRVVVVGASLAGLRTAEQLRRVGHRGPITVLGAEPHLPYNRPPLSKEVLADPEQAEPEVLAERLAFRRRSSTANVEFRLGDAVTAADLTAGTLTTAGGRQHTFDGLVAATGLRPRRLGVPGPTRGRHVLRTVEDCHGLRTEVSRGPRSVVVVGAGFVGCEVAATLVKAGHTVTVIEPAGAPMARVLGSVLADAVQRHHEAAGIRFRIGLGVAAYAGTGSVSSVLLTSGEEILADIVVEAVGSVCNVEWLAGNGLDLSDGVLVDNHLQVVSNGPGTPTLPIVAVGDIARFPNPRFDHVPRRVEHWSIPTDTAKRAAVSLVAAFAGDTADAADFAPVPSFWSDQLDLRFQSFGSTALAEDIRVEEGDVGRLSDGLLASYHRDGRHIGTLAINLSPARQRDLRAAFAPLVPTP